MRTNAMLAALSLLSACADNTPFIPPKPTPAPQVPRVAPSALPPAAVVVVERPAATPAPTPTTAPTIQPMVPNKRVPPIYGPLPDAFSFPLPGSDARPWPPAGPGFPQPPIGQVSPGPEGMAAPAVVLPTIVIVRPATE